jgi:hypothetical protein
LCTDRHRARPTSTDITTLLRVFDLFNDSEPAARFSLSALIALVASAAVAGWAAYLLWGIAISGGYPLLIALLAFATLVPLTLAAALLCFVAIYFKQGRWGAVGFAIMGLPYAVFVGHLVVVDFVRQ